MNRGEVLFYPGFVFRDGGLSDKLFVVLNYADGGDQLIIAKTTSQQRTRKQNPGCDHLRCTFFVPQKQGFFQKDTWIILDFPYAFTQDEIKKKLEAGEVKIQCTLPEQMMNAVCNCALKSDDFPVGWAALLKKRGSCAIPARATSQKKH